MENKDKPAYPEWKWISPKDRFPDHGHDVVVIISDGTPFMARFYENHGGWRFYFADTGLQKDDSKRMTVLCWTEIVPPKTESPTIGE